MVARTTKKMHGYNAWFLVPPKQCMVIMHFMVIMYINNVFPDRGNASHSRYHRHTQKYFLILVNQPKSYCIYNFAIDSEPSGFLFGVPNQSENG